MDEKREEVHAGPVGTGNYLGLALKVFAIIVVFNIIAAIVFYFFISPHMVQHVAQH